MKGRFGTGLGGKSTKYKEFTFSIMYHESTASFYIEMPKDYGDYRFHPYWGQCEIIGSIHDVNQPTGGALHMTDPNIKTEATEDQAAINAAEDQANTVNEPDSEEGNTEG